MAWHCQHPDHVGDRLIQFVTMRYSKRVTYMAADGSHRLYERVVMRLCRECVERENAEPPAPDLFAGSAS